ncbi:hypothetical protein CEXT_204451 [Caerostris extrusa]|uniref:Uncharacterized protein n=1 Tax=Caerostris extrusa TaxID=172846 RepID=A0AAV4T2G2_CAEEX|nr:hypothetical protein CEXT_204451 [Caerostris extrusa]
MPDNLSQRDSAYKRIILSDTERENCIAEREKSSILSNSHSLRVLSTTNSYNPNYLGLLMSKSEDYRRPKSQKNQIKISLFITLLSFPCLTWGV